MAHRSSIVTLYTAIALFGLLAMYSRSVTMFGAPQLRRLSHPRSSRARLKLAQVVFRHGSRSPLNLYYWPHTKWDVCQPTYEGFDIDVVDSAGAKDPPPLIDKNASTLPGGCKMGQLTSTGYQQAKDLGAWLKHRYTQEFSLLPSSYQEGVIFSWTTSFTRTINTLRGVLSGLYPDAAMARTSITAVSAMPDKEIMYGINATCPRLGPMIEARRLQIEKWEANSKEVKKDAEAVRKALGFKKGEAVVWSQLHDTLAAMRVVKKKVKGLTEEIWATVVRRATYHESAIIAPCDHDMAICKTSLQLSLGRLADALLVNMAAAAKCAGPPLLPSKSSSSRKPCGVPPLMLYSGHDSTIIPLMAMLGHPLEVWPTYASHVVFELWQYTSQRNTVSHYVRVLYNGNHLQLRKSTALGSLIPYSEFVDKMKHFAVNEKQHQEMCARPQHSQHSQHG